MTVVAEQQQEHRCTRQQHAGQGLHRVGEQSERRARRQHQHGSEHDQPAIDAIEAFGVPRLAVQRVLDREHVADRISRGEGDRCRADDAGIQQCDGKQHRRQPAGIFFKSDRGPQGVGVVAEFRGPGKHRRAERDHRDRADHDEHNADAQVHPLIADEARRDPLVDDVALLEEQLPRRHGGADDGNDQQHHLAELGALGHLRHEEIRRDLPDRWMHHQDDGHQQQAAYDQHDTEALEAAEVAGRNRRHHDNGRRQHAPEL